MLPGGDGKHTFIIFSRGRKKGDFFFVITSKKRKGQFEAFPYTQAKRGGGGGGCRGWGWVFFGLVGWGGGGVWGGFWCFFVGCGGGVFGGLWGFDGFLWGWRVWGGGGVWFGRPPVKRGKLRSLLNNIKGKERGK